MIEVELDNAVYQWLLKSCHKINTKTTNFLILSCTNRFTIAGQE